jgi:hypothetical protein
MIDFNTPDPRFREILRLKSMLDEAKIPYECRCEMAGYIIHYPAWDDCVCSAIEHIGSYGHAEDLIEICGLTNSDDVQGWLTAENVYERIRNHYLERGDIA